MADEVLVERRDGVQLITINRPEAKNALNKAVAEGVAAAVDELDAADELRVGVLTGAGGTFSAGMDLKGFLRGESPAIEGRGLCGITQTPPRKPLIGAVEGWALAGGFELLLTGDPLNAARAAEIGLVNRLTDEGAALDGALDLAATIAANGPLAVAATKQIARSTGDWSWAESWQRQAEITASLFAGEDAVERSTAVAEKRAPVWNWR